MKQNEKTEQTKLKIIDAAMKSFGACGYSGVSLNDICKTANVPKGLMYHNFSGKEELYLCCVKKSFDSLEEYLKSSDAKNNMCSYMKERTKFFRENPNEARIFFDAVLQTPTELTEEINEVKKPLDLFTRKMCRKFISSIKLRDGISEKQALTYFETMQSMFNSYFSSPLYASESLDKKITLHKKKLDTLIDLMIYGVAVKKSRGKK